MAFFIRRLTTLPKSTFEAAFPTYQVYILEAIIGNLGNDEASTPAAFQVLMPPLFHTQVVSPARKDNL